MLGFEVLGGNAEVVGVDGVSVDALDGGLRLLPSSRYPFSSQRLGGFRRG